MTGAGRALVVGWFSFPEVIATVGDLVDTEVTTAWLRDAGWACDVAIAPYMGRGVDWRAVEPDDYQLVVFATGPLFGNELLTELFERFARCRRWALNVSVLDDTMRRYFEHVWERDATGISRPDLALVADTALAPVVAVAYAPPQPEYGAGDHAHARESLAHWLRVAQLPVVELDMDMYAEHRYPRTAAQVESLLARADVVVSMRLHAMLLGLRHGRPVLAVDAVPGGGKVTRQAETLGWPCVLTAARCTPARLDAALRWCLSDDAQDAVARSRSRGSAELAQLGAEFRAAARPAPG